MSSPFNNPFAQSQVLTLQKTRLIFLMFHSGLAVGDRLRWRKLKIKKGRGEREDKENWEICYLLTRLCGNGPFSRQGRHLIILASIEPSTAPGFKSLRPALVLRLDRRSVCDSIPRSVRLPSQSKRGVCGSAR